MTLDGFHPTPARRAAGAPGRTPKEGREASMVRELEYERKSLPPLSQSRYGDMSCETLYIQKHVRCERTAESQAAERGIQIHEILATYINHLVKTKRSTDLEVFDTLMKEASRSEEHTSELQS